MILVILPNKIVKMMILNISIVIYKYYDVKLIYVPILDLFTS